MNHYIELCNQWSLPWIEQAWTLLWQSTLLIVVVAMLMRLFRKASPKLRFWLWQVVAIKLLLLPLWKVDAPQLAWLAQEVASPQTITSPDSIETSPQLPAVEPLPQTESTLTVAPVQQPIAERSLPKITWHTWLLILWLVGTLYQVARLVHQRRELKQLLGQAQPLQELRAEIERCSTLLDLKRPPTTLVVEQEISPFVCGLRSPKLILPHSLTQAIDQQQLEQILLHELAHIRRRDLLWCWVPSVMQIVYWFHPAAHWVARQIQLERELACDQVAILASGSTAGEYAHTLVDVMSHTTSQIAAQAAFSAQFAGETK